MEKYTKGFTLIELIFTVIALSIITAIAIPHFTKFSAKHRVSADIFTIKSLIETSRGKAISSNHPIVICGMEHNETKSDIPLSQCTRNWQEINIISLGTNGNTLIYQELLTDSYSKIQWSAFQRKSYLTFSPAGYTQHQNGTLYLCHKTYADLHRAVVINKSGRVTIKKQSTGLIEKCKS
ncbi:MAG: GspH/FimT family pseudopilin [Kangiella sp.]|jgi:type IV fimbrial biogenesis protein FimT|nr:GspH/FimT family pseudopilin [Kangiella sp.]